MVRTTEGLLIYGPKIIALAMKAGWIGTAAPALASHLQATSGRATMKTYETELAAKNAIRMRESLGFCPEINSNCRVGCVCYVPAEPSRAVEGVWTIREACCGHVLISGIIFTES